MRLTELTDRSRLFVRGSLYALAAMWLAWVWLPIIWTFFTGIAVNAQTYPPQIIPNEITFAHYRRVVFDENMFEYIINSTGITLITTTVSVVIGSLAGYALTRYDPGDGNVAFFILSMRFLPPIAVAIPIYEIFIGFRWIDTWQSLIISYLTIGIPITTWIMLIFFQKIPQTLEEASWVDGWSRLQTWWRVIIPLAAPGISTAAILSAILMWNEYVLALVLTSSPKAQTIPIYLATSMTVRGIQWGKLAAGTTIAMTPVIVLAFIMQERLVAGFTLESVE